MDIPPDSIGPMIIRWRPLVAVVSYVGAAASSALTIGLVWLAVSGEPGTAAVVVVFALLAIPLTGFAAVMFWAEAIRRSRSPYLVVDSGAGTTTTISAFGHRRIVRLGPGERFTIEYGEACYGDAFMSGDRIVVVRVDGHRWPTHLWGRPAHRDDWARLNVRLTRSPPVVGELLRPRRCSC